MVELFQMGGLLFMSILTILLIGVLVAAGRYWTKSEAKKSDLDLIKSIGLLAVITGVLGQLIGLFSAFEAIELMGSVAPGILAAGLKVSMITTLYGMIIYIISLIIWMAVAKLKS